MELFCVVLMHAETLGGGGTLQHDSVVMGGEVGS